MIGKSIWVICLTAEHEPDYRELGRFPSRKKALEF
jgi:hypothetical protein